ncbi:MAG TPA: FMN-binding protein [Bacteroidales bacterium]|nr:FMN-binding protein [Bacteroidales bacterium]HPT00988.1 FMN-binding protein [Bacteroidales bacterium]
MIKKITVVLSVLALTAFTIGITYKDGHYRGVSRASYTNEPYYGFTRIDVKNGKIIHVDFFIRDSVKHEYFNQKYEKHFAGNPEYIQQCRNDWKGVRAYPDSLLKYQDVNKIDAISGATWSFNIFKASVKDALSKAGSRP